MKKTLALIIMDGFGFGGDVGNAIATANTPNLDRLMKDYATTRMKASGLAVGLPKGQMGNSEVGHLNLGAGRIIYQDITRIDKSIGDRDFFKNSVLLNAIQSSKKTNASLHLIGLCSNGGVHSHLRHLYAILELCKQQNFHDALIHCITDGRDTPPKSAAKFISQIEKKCKELGVGKIATVSGRYYAMDRDNRLERIQAAFDCIMNAKGDKIATATNVIKHSYEKGINDEFIKPIKVSDYDGVKSNDSIIFFNFRSDRARQLTKAILDSNFHGYFATMTMYDKSFRTDVIFPPKDIKDTLGEILSENGLTQVRLAETEKYAHVTYFFNGGNEEPFNGEKRILVQSPKVATYDLAPRMSSDELVAHALECVGKYDVMIINFANCDMVGHTGNFDATVKAVECTDESVGKVTDAILSAGGIAIVTSDHGNAEQMLDTAGGAFTAHTTNDVPFILVGKGLEKAKLKKGSLCDVAPTMLKILKINKPTLMDGESVLGGDA